MARHLMKSGYGQCKCRWCGKWSGDCQVTDEMRHAVKLFAAGNGRTWKSALRQEWETGGNGLGELTQPLMALRNVIGPVGLLKIKRHHLERIGNVAAMKGGAS